MPGTRKVQGARDRGGAPDRGRDRHCRGAEPETSAAVARRDRGADLDIARGGLGNGRHRRCVDRRSRHHPATPPRFAVLGGDQAGGAPRTRNRRLQPACGRRRARDRLARRASDSAVEDPPDVFDHPHARCRAHARGPHVPRHAARALRQAGLHRSAGRDSRAEPAPSPRRADAWARPRRAQPEEGVTGRAQHEGGAGALRAGKGWRNESARSAPFRASPAASVVEHDRLRDPLTGLLGQQIVLARDQAGERDDERSAAAHHGGR